MDKRINVLSAENYEDCGSLLEYRDLVESWIEEVPKEYIESATIDISSYSDGSGVRAEVFYYRPQTQQEIEEIERRRQRDSDCFKDRELAKLKELKAKYE